MSIKRLTCKQRDNRRRRNKGAYGGVGIDPSSYLTKDQVWTVLDYCRAEAAKGGKRAAITLILIESYLYTGLRAIELLGLQICDLPGYNGKPNVLRVPAGFAKGGKQRTILVSPIIIEKWDAYIKRFHQPALKLIASKSDGVRRQGLRQPVFINERFGRMEYRSVYSKLQIVGRKTGIPLRPHIFRHTYAVGMVGNNAHLGLIQDQLGHSSPATTKVYAQVGNNQAERQVYRLNWEQGAIAIAK